MGRMAALSDASMPLYVSQISDGIVHAAADRLGAPLVPVLFDAILEQQDGLQSDFVRKTS